MTQKFEGEFTGKYDSTKVDSNGISTFSGNITIKIQKVGKGAYLQNISYDGKEANNVLGFVKDDTIVSQNQSGNGVNYTYFDGKCLVHKVSNKPSTPNWTVNVSKLKRNKH